MGKDKERKTRGVVGEGSPVMSASIFTIIKTIKLNIGGDGNE